MNSGKSTALLQAAFNYEERGMKVAILKPAIDSKGDDQVVSRLGLSRRADVLVGPDDDVTGLLKPFRNVHCVLVDEAQFLQPRQIDDLFWLAVNGSVPVLAYGLRTDFSTVGFPGASRLLELAHEIQELKTICRCGKKALLNGRKLAGRFIFEGSQVAIDGEQDIEYESLCASCYHTFKTAAT
jgi:thymidine kinase